MKNPGRKALFALLLLAALVLSACGPVDGQQPTQSVTNPPQAQTEPAAEQPAGESSPTQPAEAAPTAAGEQAAPETEPTAPSTAATEAPAAAPTAATGAASVTQFPDPAGFGWVEIVNGLDRPLDLADTGDGSGSLLLVEKVGRIRVLQNGSLLPDAYLDITDRVRISGNEQGLLGLALHPNYLENGFFYVNYTNQDGNTVISRFSVTDDPNRADAGSEKIILTYAQPFRNHNGGVVTFGPDGYLYIGSGDGGDANDPQNNGQSLDTLLGKVLRIDVDGGDPYAIPADNPFANGGGMPEIWAYGLRNPWRISFDKLTGDLYIADVGQGALEEIDFQPAGAAGGANYGWKFREGTMDKQGGLPPGVTSQDPVMQYSHEKGCSVTGGLVYRGEELPEFNGVYFYADYCSGIMWGLLRDAGGAWQASELFQLGGRSITSFGQDSRGELYFTDDNGGVYRLQRN